MAVSIIDIAKEKARQESGDDKKFFKSFVYFFELDVPAEALEGVLGAAGGVTSMLFPLMLNPQSISVSEPYALTVTPTVDGGLFLEENGVLARTITIEGHTGFKPRPMRGSGVALSEFFKTDVLSFDRRGVFSPLALSGQRHFQFLQDRVFRTYAELKRDPATSRLTRLAFHNVKDDEHWLVAPIRFDMRRNAADSRFTYRYSIELLAYNIAKKREDEFVTEDKSWLDKIKDTIQDIKNTVDSIIAVIEDVQQFVRELEQLVTGVISLLNKVSEILNAAVDFISGVADFIAAPFQALIDVVRGLDETIERMIALPDQFRDTITHTFRQLGDALLNFGAHKDVFASPAQQRIAKLNSLSTIGTSTSDTALADAEANPPKTLRATGKLGTKPMPGDRIRADASRGATRAPAFSSAIEYVVSSTDTLQSLAARFLGGAKNWRLIAALNDLAPPYISESPLPRTVRPGGHILIPSRARAPLASPNAAVLGATREVSLAERVLGVDLRLDPVEGTRDQYDLVLDPASGGTDVKLIKGVNNLKQAIRTRMITEQGSNVLYRRLGHKRLIGIGIPSVEDEVVRLRLREAIAADPRIANVGAVRFNEPASPDTIDVEIDATVRGLNEPITVSAGIS